MKSISKILSVLFVCLLAYSCSDDAPIDDRGLLITDSEECYMSVFELKGPDDRNTLVSYTIDDIDDTHGTVTAIAAFGTNLKHVKPNCSIAKDAILEPKMGSWIDFSESRTYTVIAGNRKDKKSYTITVKVEGE